MTRKSITKKKERTPTIISRRKRKAFLKILSETGQVGLASQSAGYADSTYLQRLRREDETFAEEWDLAVDVATDMMEDEANRRAFKGIMEPEYYKGEVVGYTKKYSDTLAMFMLKALRPDKFRERNTNGGNINLNLGVAVIPMTNKNEDNWEQDAIEVHATQIIPPGDDDSTDIEDMSFNEIPKELVRK